MLNIDHDIQIDHDIHLIKSFLLQNSMNESLHIGFLILKNDKTLCIIACTVRQLQCSDMCDMN